jgi:hypothetical protein
MNLSRTLCAFLIALTGLVGGCTDSAPLEKEQPRPQQKADAQNQREILSEGYSMLYKDLDDLSKIHLIFLVKSEAKPVNDLTTAVTEYADSLKSTLERVARDYPAVNIKLTPLPAIEQRTREAMGKDRVLSFAPVVGLTGESFDRRVLQSLEGLLNHLRFSAKALADEEPEPSLKQIATTAHDKLDQFYKQVVDMLTEKYYINTGEQKVAHADRKVTSKEAR